MKKAELRRHLALETGNAAAAIDRSQARLSVVDDAEAEAVESPDGQSLYYNKYGYYTIGLFQSKLDGSSEVQVLDLPQLISFGDWLVTAKGIYYIKRYEGISKKANPVSIQFLDFATHQTKLIAALPHDPTSDPGLNISPDGQWFFYSIDDYKTLDIMLLDNFH